MKDKKIELLQKQNIELLEENDKLKESKIHLENKIEKIKEQINEAYTTGKRALDSLIDCKTVQEGVLQLRIAV